VIKWVFERVSGRGDAVETPIGLLPAPGALDLSGLDLSPDAVGELLRVDVDDWRKEVPLLEEHFAVFGDHLPQGLRDELAALEKRLTDS
jgi:phosphoenolpyruvate carboxykinase (GTP)